MLWATTQMALWWHQHFGNFDAAEMLTPHNVEHFAMFVNAGRSDGWRHGARANLRRVGRTVNPGQWPLMAPTVGFRDAMAPYQQQQESRFARAALLPGRLNRAARIWVVVASFGAGLNGREAFAATVDDLTEHNDGRIVVTVCGPNARRVPIRRSYTAMAREAITASDGMNFFLGTSPNAAYRVRGTAAARSCHLWQPRVAVVHPCAQHLDCRPPHSAHTIRRVACCRWTDFVQDFVLSDPARPRRDQHR